MFLPCSRPEGQPNSTHHLPPFGHGPDPVASLLKPIAPLISPIASLIHHIHCPTITTPRTPSPTSTLPSSNHSTHLITSTPTHNSTLLSSKHSTHLITSTPTHNSTLLSSKHSTHLITSTPTHNSTLLSSKHSTHLITSTPTHNSTLLSSKHSTHLITSTPIHNSTLLSSKHSTHLITSTPTPKSTSLSTHFKSTPSFDPSASSLSTSHISSSTPTTITSHTSTSTPTTSSTPTTTTSHTSTSTTRGTSSTPTPPATTTTPPASVLPPAPALTFKSFTPTTCLSSTINWVYTGGPNAVNLTLKVDNNVPQGAPPSPAESSTTNLVSRFSNSILRRQAGTMPSSITNETLSSQVDPDSGFFSWHSVNLPQGWYQIHAIAPPPCNEIAMPSKFYITEGSDTSCLPQSNSRITPRTTAIAGGTIGGIVAVIGLCICGFFVYRRRTKSNGVTNEAAPVPRGSNEPLTRSVPLSIVTSLPNRHQTQNPNDPETQNMLTATTPRTPLTPLLPPRRFASIYSESGESLRGVDSARHSFTFAHPTSEHDTGYSESHPTLRSDSWSVIASPQPYNTRSSMAGGTRPLHVSIADSEGTLSSLNSPSTVLPLYEPPLSPPSFHTVEATSNRTSVTSIHPSISTLSLSRAGSEGLSYIFALSPLF